MDPTLRSFHKFVKTQKRQDFVKNPAGRERRVDREGCPESVRRVGPGTRWP
ncbi:hypothetical protein Pen02_74370 [Plantactinospora endophytica]|uniref:Uncharacterized protein n=1 Tax=Plantactinospora endophytica TaxID=673535 RepID=A0ABQ4ECP3_9ACTN|nr:hypothetical protein Pen02_74370 [Plantactinospora endophytica]